MAGRVVMVKIYEMMSKQWISASPYLISADFGEKHVHAKATDRPVVSWLSRALGSRPTKNVEKLRIHKAEPTYSYIAYMGQFGSVCHTICHNLPVGL